MADQVDVNFESLSEWFALYHNLDSSLTVRMTRPMWDDLHRPDYITVTLEGHDLEYSNGA